MANKSWVRQNYVKPDDTEKQLLKELEQLKSSIPYNASAIDRQRRKLNVTMAEHRGMVGKKQNPAKFAEYLTTRVCAGIFFGSVHLYNFATGIYEEVPEDTIKSFQKAILDEYPCSIWSVAYENSYYTAFCRELTSYCEIDGNPNYLVLNNGILSLKTMRLHKHTPKVIKLTGVPYDYDPKTTAPHFLAAVNDIFNGHKPTIDNLQELFGYVLYYGQEYPLQKLFVFYGTGRNGKGVISRCISLMLGEQNCSAIFADELQDRFGRQNLVHKLVNISPEKSNMKPLDTAYIKSLTGGDMVEIEQKYKKAFSTRIFTKFIICTNQMLNTNDSSHGFFSRLVIFPFENTYVEVDDGQDLPEHYKPMDKGLIDKIKQEKAGILNWALEGLNRLRRNNWNMTDNPKVRSLTAKHYSQTNPVSNFVYNCVEEHSGSRIKTSEVYECFMRWARRSKINVLSYENRKKFRELFLKSCADTDLPVAVIKNSVEYYCGIKLTKHCMVNQSGDSGHGEI